MRTQKQTVQLKDGTVKEFTVRLQSVDELKDELDSTPPKPAPQKKDDTKTK